MSVASTTKYIDAFKLNSIRLTTLTSIVFFEVIFFIMMTWALIISLVGHMVVTTYPILCSLSYLNSTWFKVSSILIECILQKQHRSSLCPVIKIQENNSFGGCVLWEGILHKLKWPSPVIHNRNPWLNLRVIFCPVAWVIVCICKSLGVLLSNKTIRVLDNIIFYCVVVKIDRS